MGKKVFIDEGKAVSRKVSVIIPYEKDGVHQTGKFEWGGLHMYNVRVEGYPKPVAMAFKKEDAPKVGDTIDLAICVEDEKWHKGYLPEQLEKAKSGGGGGYRGSDSKHAGWATMYAIHLQLYIKEGMSFSEARKAAAAATNEVFKLMEV